MGDAIDAQNNDDVDDDYDILLDMLDALEHQPSTEVGLAAGIFAERILDSVADLSETESAFLTTAILQSTSRVGRDCALVAFKSLFLRVRGRAPDN
jgi:hypothetical protein